MSARWSLPTLSRRRPGAAVAAGVIGIVFGAQILIGSVAEWSYVVETGMTWLLAVVALIGVSWLVGGIQMLGGRRRGLLLGSVVWLMLMLAFVVWGWINTRTHPGSSISLTWVVIGAVMFASVPVLILSLAYRPAVTDWITDGARG